MRNTRNWLAASTAVMALCAALPAVAQPVTTNPNQPPKAAAAADEADAGTVVEQVIVTTERRATNVQETPLAVTA